MPDGRDTVHERVPGPARSRVPSGIEQAVDWNEEKRRQRSPGFYSRHGQEVGDYFLDSLFCRYRLVVIVYRVLDLRQSSESIRDHLEPDEQPEQE